MQKKDLILRYQIFEIDKIDNFIASRRYNIEKSKKKNIIVYKKQSRKSKKLLKNKNSLLRKEKLSIRNKRCFFYIFIIDFEIVES